MILLTLSFIQISFCQVFPSEHQSERLNACYSLVKLKLSLDKSTIDKFSKSFENPEKVINFIGTELLMSCYTSITLENSEKVLKAADNTILSQYCQQMLNLDLNKYHKDNIELGHKHFTFFKKSKTWRKWVSRLGYLVILCICQYQVRGTLYSSSSFLEGFCTGLVL